MNEICDRCGNEMTTIRGCHMRCERCGAELTCGDL